MSLTAEDYAADTIGRELGRVLVEYRRGITQFGWQCDGLLSYVKRESQPGWPQTGHRDERAAWKAKQVAHIANVLKLVEPWPVVESYTASWR